MAKNTPNYEFEKPEQNDFYDVDVQNRNWDKAETALTEFDDAGSVDEIKSFPDFLKKFVTGNKLAVTMRNLKAGLQFVLHAGQIVNNCVTDNAGLPLSAAQGKVLKDLYTQLYSDLNTTNNNLSNAGIPTVKKITDLYAIKKSGFYCYDAGASNAPMSSRGGMVIANYLSDAWISLNVVPYALSKIYTNSKYNSTWTGWSELASKNDFVIKTYTIAGKAVNAETTADFEPNIALSGYTPLGIVGTRLNAYGSVTLVYADLVDDTKARVRVRNNGTESVTGDNVIIRVLYFKS